MAKSKKKYLGGRPKGTTGPYKLNDKVQDRIVQALIVGETLEIAAAYGGIDQSTFSRWRAKGKKIYKAHLRGKEISEAEKPLLDFHLAIEDALVQSEVRAAHAIDVGFTGIKTEVVEEKFDKVTGELISRKTYERYIVPPDWKAAESKLSRRYPDRWGNKDKITHEGNPDKPIVATTLRDFVLNAARKQKELKEREKEHEAGKRIKT